MTALTDLLRQMDLVEESELWWREHSACAGMDPNLFMPERGCSAAEAKSVCSRCEVWQACGEYALKNHLRDGVWGGTTEKGRRIILQARRLGLPMELTPPQLRVREPKCSHPYWCLEKETYRRMYGWTPEDEDAVA